MSKALANSESPALIIDDFLQPKVLESLQYFLSKEATFRRRYKLRSEQGDTNKEIFLAAPEDSRLLSLEAVSGTHPGFETSPNSFTFMALKMALKKDTFYRYFEQIGNVPITSTSMITVKQLSGDDFFAPHNDSSPGRQLCCVLYLSPDWKAEYGSGLAFGMPNGEVTVDVKCNRLVVFRPLQNVRHWLTPRNPDFKDIPRWNMSWWYFNY